MFVKLFLAHLVEMMPKKSLRGRHIGPLTKLFRSAANLDGQYVGHHVFYYIMKKKKTFFKFASIQLRPGARGRHKGGIAQFYKEYCKAINSLIRNWLPKIHLPP